MEPVHNAPIPFACSTGLIPRDYSSHPSGCHAFAPTFPTANLIDKSEWADRLNENRKNKVGLLDIRQANIGILQSLNQSHWGLCWSFSTTKAVMYIRKIMGLPDVKLSGWWLAGLIKNWRDEGGWGAASLSEAVSVGVATDADCPAYQSQYDTPATRAKAADNKVTSWWDGTEDHNLNTQIAISMLLQSVPCVVDLNDMGHSMCCIDIKSLNPLTLVYDNSWGTVGDPDGLYYGTGARARPDGLVVPRVVLPTMD